MLEWLERTRKVRATILVGLSLLTAAYFARLGMWGQMWWSVGLAVMGIALFLVPNARGRSESIPDIETSVRRVGARKGGP